MEKEPKPGKRSPKAEIPEAVLRVIESARASIEKAAWNEYARTRHASAGTGAPIRREISAMVDLVLRNLRTGEFGSLEEPPFRVPVDHKERLPFADLEKLMCAVLGAIIEAVENAAVEPVRRVMALKTVCRLMHALAANSAEARAMRERHLLLDAAKLLTSTLSLSEVLQRVGRLAADITGVEYTALFLPDEGGERLHMTELYSMGGPKIENLVHRFRTTYDVVGMRVGQGAVGRSYESGEPMLISDYSRYPGHLEALLPDLRSMLVVPMKLRGRSVGVFTLLSLRTNAFTEEDLALMSGVADQAAIAVNNAQVYEREKNIADTLQQSFLPASIPEVPGYELAARHKAALKESEVGGDFYDVFQVPDGRVAIVVADVSGKGLAAAVHTATGKYVVRAYAFEDPSPGRVLQRCNRMLHRCLPSGMFITTFYVLLDPTEHTFTYANAGHNPPIFYSSGSKHTTYLDVTGPGLGGFPEVKYGERQLSIQADDLLFAYTDGAVDVKRKNRFLELDGLERLLWEHLSLSADQTVGSVFDAVLDYSQGRLSDDVVLVVVKKQR